MTINRVGPLDPINNIDSVNKGNKVQKANEGLKGESISISKSAMDKSELIKTANLVHSAPDIRLDKINEIKEKLKDPNYINSTVINSVAEKIMDDFGI